MKIQFCECARRTRRKKFPRRSRGSWTDTKPNSSACLLAETEQIELRWHLALMVPRLRLSATERQRAAAALQRYLEDRSSIVRTFALQGLADLARNDLALQSKVKQLLEAALQSDTPAMKARARKSLKLLTV